MFSARGVHVQAQEMFGLLAGRWSETARQVEDYERQREREREREQKRETERVVEKQERCRKQLVSQ